MQGTIKRLVADKKFGFIGQDGEAKDVFFHASGLNGIDFMDLQVGDVVTFDLEQSDKGPKAVNVMKA